VRISRRKWLVGAAGLLGAAAAGVRLFEGFEDDPAADSAASLPPEWRRCALDVHTHVLGVGTGGSGCWMSPQMRGSLPVRAGLRTLGLHVEQDDLDQAYIGYLNSRLRGAGFLRQVVLLAMDAVYTTQGQRDLNATPYFTPNDYVAALAAKYSQFLFGASVHPYRGDALDELDRAAAAGAVLVKWIPNVQGIDLGEARCRAFYRRMAFHRMPLLVHTGDEYALFVAGQELGDPRRLQAPLEEGVTVIAAHAATLGERDGRSNFDHLVNLFPRWPNLFADTSALTLITRWRSLLRIAQRQDLFPRLVHGSDFPLPPATTLFLGRVPLHAWWRAWTRENPLRRDFEIKRALGLPLEIFTRGYTVLAPRLSGAALPAAR
jgi:predicted TIM-barrel fold metal-dependent hydrolase